MLADKKVAVIIPFYKPELTAYEQVSLQQCFKVLGNYPIIAIKPESLVLPDEISRYSFAEVICFPDDYFKGVQGYNRLTLSAVFYNAFAGYEYMLIHQLDAFVFKDELAQWCNKDIDYVGPPWIRLRYNVPRPEHVRAQIEGFIYSHINIWKKGIDSLEQLENKVGNGGFSLRRVKKLAVLCESMKPKIDYYNSRNEHQFNEDVFWSFEVNRGKKRLNIPNYKEALKFGFEIAPERARNLNNGQLPFGCHAWDLNTEFWRPIFKEYDYDI